LRFLQQTGLKPKGIPGSKVTIWRKEKVGKFPKRSRFGKRFCGSFEAVIDRYNLAIAAGHSEEKATVIAEQFLAQILAKGDEAIVPKADESDAAAA
jgi:hypothetical protein